MAERSTSIRFPAWGKVRIVVHMSSDPRSDRRGIFASARRRREYPGCEEFDFFRSIEFPENIVLMELWSTPKIYDEFWHKLTMDARIVRNGAKIMSVRDNARFVLDMAKAHGSFGKFLSQWPPSNEIGLLEVLAKRGSRLGGNSGQMLLRFLGYDAFVATKDVAACLRDAGLDIAEAPTSKRDLLKIQ